jgi:hypothetical protein
LGDVKPAHSGDLDNNGGFLKAMFIKDTGKIEGIDNRSGDLRFLKRGVDRK